MIAPLLAALVVLAGTGAVRAVLRAGDRASVLRVGPALPVPRAPTRFVVALDDAAIPASPSLVWSAWLASAGVALVVGAVAGGLGLAVVATAVAVGGPVAALAAVRGRGLALVEAQLPDLLDAVARSLRSGSTVRQALAEAAPSLPGRLGADLVRVADDADGGLGFDRALEAWARRCPGPGVRLTVAAIGLAEDAGGAAARAVDGVAATLRANLAVVGEVRAQSSQARLSALVIAAAPLAFSALAAGTDGRTAHFLLRTPFGLACLVAGLALDALAAWWMHRITVVPA